MDRILVINNDFDTMTLLKDLLEKQSYQVKYTSSGDESLQVAKAFAPDLLLVDVLQQNCIEDLKKNSSTADIPIILMTGYSSNDKAIEADVEAIIEKPFLLKQLQEIIQGALAKVK
ncbi:MAG: response regulator [Ferruginibacter sp.]